MCISDTTAARPKTLRVAAACRERLAPQAIASHTPAPRPQVAPGPEGYKQFTQAIRKAFHLPDDSELNITFTCDEPSSGGACS
jgi:hypothetical protein